VVEHSLGKGEVESSILSNSTIFSRDEPGALVAPWSKPRESGKTAAFHCRREHVASLRHRKY
jgi:hypothetical protein